LVRNPHSRVLQPWMNNGVKDIDNPDSLELAIKTLERWKN
jgi:hypothetical protein